MVGDPPPAGATGTTPRAEVVVVGGGHNGLVCAAYLARAGLDVCVVEKNPDCGGALFSSTAADGTVLEHGGVDHSTIVASSIPDDLDLAAHGLRYLDRTASALHVFGDGVRVAVAGTAEETARSIAAVDQADAEAWLELVGLAEELMGFLADLSDGRAVPLPLALAAGRAALGRRGRPLLDLAALPVIEVAERWFRSPHLRALCIFRSGFSGLPAWYPGTGAVFCLTPAGHGRRFARPAGGSAAFVRSLLTAITASGGRVITGFTVEAIERYGHGWLVRSGDDAVIARRAVVSALPPQDALLGLVRPATEVPALVRERLGRARVTCGNLSQFTIAAALAATPDLTTLTAPGYEGSMLWLLDEPADVLASQTAALAGALADRPGVLATFPSSTDPTAAPAGQASLWVNGFLAAELRDPGWAASAPAAQERIWSTVDACLPGVRELVTEARFTSPADLTARTAALNPGQHLATTLDQLLGGRPARGIADHRSGVEGLYLTGAGTNPGPSISGLPGKAAAEAVLRDLGGRPSAVTTARWEASREWRRLRALARRSWRTRRR